MVAMRRAKSLVEPSSTTPPLQSSVEVGPSAGLGSVANDSAGRVQVPSHRPHVLVACSSGQIWNALAPVVRSLNASICYLADTDRLEDVLTREGPFDLVLGESLGTGRSGLGAVAWARRGGRALPFIMIQSVHESLMRVIVGGGRNGVLTTRVVNDCALAEMASELLSTAPASPSTRSAWQ